jgi:hypothetical protein
MIHKAHNRFRIGTVTVVLAAATMVCTSAQIAQGSISGIVYGPDGKPLAGTTVWANIVSPVSLPVDRNSTVPALTTVSASDGSYTLSKVPAGEYVVCARNAAVAALNPCPWGGAPLVQIATGHLNMTGEAIHMAAGTTLQVHLDDPAGLLAAKCSQARRKFDPGLGYATRIHAASHYRFNREQPGLQATGPIQHHS